jgi:4-amino-4-deoxy-L-arabinose transferase-like glycosyltransferase
MYFAARATLERKDRKQFLLAYACMALATLTKGFIGVALPALILISFVLIRRDWRLIAEAKLPSGIAVFLLIAAPWFFLVSRATGGQWLSDFIFVHHIQRYTAGVGHREPVYYYLKTLPLDFLPWTIVCAPALFTYSIDLKSLRQPQRLFFLLWFAAVFVFFTASNTKRDLYLLPLFPPLGLFVGNYIEDLATRHLARERLFRWVLAITFALIGLACLSAPIFVWFKYREGFFASLPFACVVGVGSLWVVFMALRRSPRAVCAAICMMMALGVAVAGGWLLPFVDRFKSPRTVADEVRRRIAPDAPLYIYTDSMHDYNFYLERESIPVIPSAAELKKLRNANAPGYLLIKQKDLREAALEPQDEMLLNRGAPASRAWYLVPLRAISQ